MYLPLTLPGVMAGLVLVFTVSLGFFVIPAILGGTRDIFLAQLIEFNINQSLNWGFAGALSLVLVATTLALFWAGDRWFGLRAVWGVPMTVAGQRRIVDLAVTAIVVAVCCFMLLPTLIVIPISFSAADFISFPPVGFSLRWYELFNVEPTVAERSGQQLHGRGVRHFDRHRSGNDGERRGDALGEATGHADHDDFPVAD